MTAFRRLRKKWVIGSGIENPSKSELPRVTLFVFGLALALSASCCTKSTRNPLATTVGTVVHTAPHNLLLRRVTSAAVGAVYLSVRAYTNQRQLDGQLTQQISPRPRNPVIHAIDSRSDIAEHHPRFNGISPTIPMKF